MIVAKLCGGLGNQMFQYAAGRRLAYRLKTRLRLDVTGLEVDPLRSYCLKYLAIEERLATSKDIDLFFAPPGVARKYTAFWQRLGFKSPCTILQENLLLSFNPEILTARDNVYLEGYWQSEKYFHDIAGIVRDEFTVKPAPDEKNLEVLRAIEGSNAVCVHVRRGDYITNPDTYKVHGTCPVEYYQRGIEIIRSRVSEPHFFVFSDDPSWTKEHIAAPSRATYVSHNSIDNAHEDLRLMYSCKHFIIANSSLSWWAAWLSRNPHKTVLAPKEWLKDKSYDRKDLIPDGWEEI